MEKAAPSNNWHYNKKLKDLARNQRFHMTKAEACLWKYVLKAGQLRGYTFRRQRPILNYIADFMSKDLMLVIEVDGFGHSWEEIQEKDKQRDTSLREEGFEVIRISNSQVLTDIEGVRKMLELWIEKNIYRFPPPNPRQRGKGSF